MIDFFDEKIYNKSKVFFGLLLLMIIGKVQTRMQKCR